jgi:tetratricopeptide (TPR) repeat protein
MKLSGFFSSTTATCTATAIVALACCPVVISIRAHREARRTQPPTRLAVPDAQSLATGAKQLPWKAVSRNTMPLPSTRSALEQWQTVHGAPVDDSTGEKSTFELPPPSTPLVSIEPPTATAQNQNSESLENMSFLPARSDLNHSPLAERRDEPPQATPDPLPLIPAANRSNWDGSNAGLNVVVQRAAEQIKRAFSLADKGAVYSSRKQLESVLQTIAHGLDAQYGQQAHSDCLALGLLALQEARDFLPVSGSARSRVTVDVTTAKHQSQLLAKSAREQLDPVEAMRRYYAYAQEHLVAAVGGAPVASQAFYGLGKLAMAQAVQDAAAQRAHNLNALTLFQVAVITNQANYLAANELGVLLAREGRLEDARTALQMSVAVQPLAEAWHNLTVVHQRLGEYERSLQARREWQRVAQFTQATQPSVIAVSNGSTVHWVDKATFERGVVSSTPVLGSHAAGGMLR